MLAACTPSGDYGIGHRGAINRMADTYDYKSVIMQAFDIESALSRSMSDYGENIPAELSSLQAQFYNVLNEKLVTFASGHFVELRTVIYNEAADAYSSAQTISQLRALEHLQQHCSSMVYIDGQRACDPPADVRRAYHAAKKLAQGKHDAAMQRILGK